MQLSWIRLNVSIIQYENEFMQIHNMQIRFEICIASEEYVAKNENKTSTQIRMSKLPPPPKQLNSNIYSLIG